MNVLARSRHLLLDHALTCLRSLQSMSSSTTQQAHRQIACLALSTLQTGDPALRNQACSTLKELVEHRGPYATHGTSIEDSACTALADDLLTWSRVLASGLEEARPHVAQRYERMERRYWLAPDGLYADHLEPTGKLAPYRSQRSNLRTCQALLAAFDASGEPRYLRRAETLAYNMTVRQADMTAGLVWEHYQRDWSPDWDHGHDLRLAPGGIKEQLPSSGYDSATQIAWALILLQLERHPVALERPPAWMFPRALALFDSAVARRWDQLDGIVDAVDHLLAHANGAPSALEVHVDALLTTALLAMRSGLDCYEAWHDKLAGRTRSMLARHAGTNCYDTTYQLFRAVQGMSQL